MQKYILSILLIFTSGYAYACEGVDEEWSPTNYSNMHTVEGPYTIKQIEKKHTYIPAGQTEPVLFGSSNKKWKKFKKNIHPGDQFYYVKLEFGNDSIEKYIIVRDKCVVGRYPLSATVIKR